MTPNKELINSSASSYGGYIDCSFQNISNLSGIEKFTSIIHLYCYNNSLTSVDGAKSLTKLSTLHLDRNSVTYLPDLSQLTKLNMLYCSSNKLSELPDLSANTSLTYLDCFNNNISKTTGLDKLINLETFNCFNNSLTGLPDLSNLSKLTTFQCHNNKITSLIWLNKLTNLKTLSIGDNPLATLPNISALTNLTLLSIPNANLTVAPNVSSMKNLETYICNNNNFSQLPSFGTIKNMTNFNCQNNQLDSLPSLSNFAFLQQLKISNNKLKTIPNITASSFSLREFMADGNQLSELPDFTSFSNLTKLQVENNQLTFEDLLPLKKITTLTKFTYAPQAIINTSSTVYGNENQTINIVVGIDKNIKNNSYIWYKDGNLLRVTKTDSLKIQKVSFADAGVYTCQIKNDSLPALTLYTTPSTLVVNPCLNLSKMEVQTTDFDCNIGGRININEASILGGTKPYSYSLTSNETGKKHITTSNVISNLFETSYTLEVQDKSGCVSNKTVAIKGRSGSDCKSLVIVLESNGQNGSLNIEETGTVKIYNKSGMLVKTIQAPAIWDGTLNSGETLPGYYVMELNGKYTNVTIIK